jgi:hypothetical protein
LYSIKSLNQRHTQQIQAMITSLKLKISLQLHFEDQYPYLDK